LRLLTTSTARIDGNHRLRLD